MSGFTVQNSSPALADLSSLDWEFNGPTAINYILTDDTVARDASDKLFLAGVLGALATGFVVEFLKTCFELRGAVADAREKRKAQKEREEEKAKRERDRTEEIREREAYREALTRIVADQSGTQNSRTSKDRSVKAHPGLLISQTTGEHLTTAQRPMSTGTGWPG